MSLYLRGTLERGRHDGDVEMAAFARAGMTRVLGAVVADFEQRGMQRLLERGTQSLDAGAHVDSPGPVEPEGCRRMIQKTRPNVNKNNNGIMTKVLKLTQASWLMVNAIQRLAAPSAR